MSKENVQKYSTISPNCLSLAIRIRSRATTRRWWCGIRASRASLTISESKSSSTSRAARNLRRILKGSTSIARPSSLENLLSAINWERKRCKIKKLRMRKSRKGLMGVKGKWWSYKTGRMSSNTSRLKIHKIWMKAQKLVMWRSRKEQNGSIMLQNDHSFHTNSHLYRVSSLWLTLTLYFFAWIWAKSAESQKIDPPAFQTTNPSLLWCIDNPILIRSNNTHFWQVCAEIFNIMIFPKGKQKTFE